MSKEVNQEDLDAFLEGSPDKVKVSKEDAENIQSELKGESPEDPEETADEGSTKPNMDPTFLPNQNTQQEQMRWTMTVPRVGSVEVSTEEKKIYLKGMLNDTPIIFPIKVEGADTTIEFQTKTAADLDVIFLALASDIEDGLSKDPSSHLSRLQHYSLCFMLRKVGTQSFDRFEPDLSISYKDRAEALRKHRERVFSNMQTARLNMIIYAGSVFEAKISTCDKNIHNRNFLDPAD